jgi:hypothetical protein
LFFSTRASAVAYANGARVCFNKPLSVALLANANSEPDQLLISERNRESEV